MRLNLWFVCSLLFFSSGVFSQDTIAPVAKPQSPTHIRFIRAIDLDQLNASEYALDSSLSSFHRMRGFLYHITQERNIFMEEIPISKRVVNFSDDITLPYKFSEHTIKYYRLNKRFTGITYLLGAKKEQLLDITYSQTILRGWSAGIDFRRIGGDGWFRQQQIYQSSFDAFTHYESKFRRYNLYAYYLRNRLEQQENGGINNFNPDENTVAQPSYLSTAQNNQADKEILLRQSFQFRKQVPDSLHPDKKFLTLGHKLRYEIKGNAYFDNPSDSFYKFTYLDTSITSDSTWYQRWNNELSLEFGPPDTADGLSLSLSAGHEYFIYKYGSPEIYFFSGDKENYYGCGAVSWNKNINHFNGKMCFYGGDYGEDHDFEFKLSRDLRAKNVELKVFARGNSSVAHPNISDIRKFSNHFIWFNDFKPVKSQNTELGFATKVFFYSAAFYTYDNLIYYDSTSFPKQSDESITYFKLKLQMNFHWRNWILENVIEYQLVDNKSKDIIHLPAFLTGHSLCYEKYMFRNALFARAGMDVRYVSSYLADRYSPALQEFHLQYDEKTGGYLLADIFFTFRVKTARFFIRLENIFNGVSSEPKFARPDYPLTPRAIRFGIQVRFFD